MELELYCGFSMFLSVNYIDTEDFWKFLCSSRIETQSRRYSQSCTTDCDPQAYYFSDEKPSAGERAIFPRTMIL